MSIIAAGTSSGTALVSTGNTNGTLVIQTNGTTVAATFGTDQSLTLVGALSAPSIAGNAVATQAQQETGTSTTVLVTPGRQQFHQSAAKVWANVNGAGTSLLASFGVSSIADVGTGILTINFSTSFSSASYSAIGSLNQDGVGVTPFGWTAQGASSCTFYVINFAGTATSDPGNYNFAAYGDQ